MAAPLLDRLGLRRLGALVPEPVRDAARPLARRVGLAAPPGEWWQLGVAPWVPPSRAERRAGAWCNVCRWRGDTFASGAHSEFAHCPRCGSIARDRFLRWCFLTRTPSPGGVTLVETSPRMGDHYRELMRRWFDYRTSDFDLGAHTGDMQLDLQDIDLPDASLDVVLTAHVLEHVPDTGRALAELFRVIRPGGRMYLQVPLVYGVTSVPVEPEFHADNTPVFFNFGWDLTDQLRAAGFTTTVLVTEEYERVLRSGTTDHEASVDGFHLDQLVEHVRPGDLTAVATPEQARLVGFRPGHHFATWECLRP